MMVVRFSLRYLIRHPWQSIFMVIGIALGVAVMVSIDLANASARQAFELSSQSITGRATHRISGGAQGVPDELYARLRIEGVARQATPQISTFVSVPEAGGLQFNLTGIDPFSDQPFRAYFGPASSLPLDQLTTFLTRPGAVLITRQTAERYDLSPGDLIHVQQGGLEKEGMVAGIMDPSDDLTRRGLEGVLLADIATVQELSGRSGWLDGIDLILSQGEVQRVEAWLPTGFKLDVIQARQGSLADMTAAFRLNLTALSLLALVVGLFLIYNTMTFAVVQRRELFGALRCLGVTRREVFGLVLVEAAVVGLLGSILGVGLGVLLGRQTVTMVSQTVNDLYFTSTVRSVALPLDSLLRGFLVGMMASLLAAALPAREAALSPPQLALQRSVLEVATRQGSLRLGLVGAFSLLAGPALLLFPGLGLVGGFAGAFLVVLGFALLASLALVTLMNVLRPLLGRMFGFLGRMAPRSLINSLSRTAVAVAALMVAVAVSIGVGVMIDSFRSTVVLWLEATLQSDVYISTPVFTGTTPSAPIEPGVVDIVGKIPGVERVDQLRAVELEAAQGVVQVFASDNLRLEQERVFLSRQPGGVRAAMQAGAVLVSEPLARRLGLLTPGGEIRLLTPDGWRIFPVHGVFYDYASSQGHLLMDLDLYRDIWGDDQITSIGLRLDEHGSPDEVALQVREATAGRQNLLVRANRTLREDVMQVFDRTFAITAALRILATLVAFIGVLNTLLLQQMEKQRETGILRALGLTGRQLWRLVMLETGLMGLAAGLLAAPTGYALALILINVINQRSFGWTIQFSANPMAFLQALVVAMIAALMAGVYPAWRMSTKPAVEVIRYE